MARQTRTQAQIDQVNNDFETFFLPVGASLDLGDFTTYGATDPAVDLSMVNTRFLKDYSSFRGTWSAAPVSGGQPIAYTAGDVVVGSDNHIYALTTLGTGTNDPATAGQTDWTLLSSADILGARPFNTSTTYTMNHMVFRGGSNPDEAGLLYVYISSTDQTGQAAPLPAVGVLSNTNWMQVGGAPSDRDEQTKIFTTANATTFMALTDIKPLDVVYVATLREWRQINTVSTDGNPLTFDVLSIPEFIRLELDNGAAQTYQLAQGDIVVATEHDNRAFVVTPAVSDFVYNTGVGLPDTWIEISDTDLNARDSGNNTVTLTTSPTSIPLANVPTPDRLVVSGTSGVRVTHTSDQAVALSYGLPVYADTNAYEVGDLVVDSDGIVYRTIRDVNPVSSDNNNNINNPDTFTALSDVILPYNDTHIYRANEAVHDSDRLFIARTNDTNTDPLVAYFPQSLMIDDNNVTITFPDDPNADIDTTAPHYDYSLQYGNGTETISISFNEVHVNAANPAVWIIPRTNVTFTPTPDNNNVDSGPSPITAISDQWIHIGGQGTTVVSGGGGGSGTVNLEIEANDVDVTGTGEALDFRFNTMHGEEGAIRGITFENGQYIIDLRPPAAPITFSYPAQRGINVGEVLPASLTYSPSIMGGDPPYSYSSTSTGVTVNSGTGVATVVPATAGLDNTISTAQTLGSVTVEDDAATMESADLMYTVTDNRGIAFTGGEQLVSRFATGSWAGTARVTNIPQTNQGNTRVLYQSGEYAGAPLPARSGDNVVLAIPYNLFNPAIANPIDLNIHDARTIDGMANTLFTASRTVSFFSPWYFTQGMQPANLAAMTAVNSAFAASQQRTFTGAVGDRTWVAVVATEAPNGIHFAAGASQTDGQLITNFTMADFTGTNVRFNLYRGPSLSAASTAFTITRL